MGSSIAWFSTYVRRTASSARLSRLSVSYDYVLTKRFYSQIMNIFQEQLNKKCGENHFLENHGHTAPDIEKKIHKQNLRQI